MTALLADCPKTGKPLKVFVMRTDQKIADLSFKSTKLLCRHCQEYHQFDKDDLYVEGSDEDTKRR